MNDETNKTTTPPVQSPPKQGVPAQRTAPPAQKAVKPRAAPLKVTEDVAMSEPQSIGRVVTREQRRPFGAHRQKLAYAIRPGFHRHWFNDTPGRLEEAEGAGYKFVADKEGRKVCRPVGVHEGGNALMGYLMEIPEEWYREDMLAQQKGVDEIDKAIKRGDVEGKVGEEGRYIPKQGISIK